ncbi:SAC3/GANP family protein [Ostreococcus tauri]|uniref:SAC3/GANP family protein n=1 Tax=Ostreococcus tauri TaxID=70448 RepID=A0A1Y5HZH0_OSTTA|nr:SAC3/GANP family protein [Ostreococcus tauri]
MFGGAGDGGAPGAPNASSSPRARASDATARSPFGRTNQTTDVDAPAFAQPGAWTLGNASGTSASTAFGGGQPSSVVFGGASGAAPGMTTSPFGSNARASTPFAPVVRSSPFGGSSAVGASSAFGGFGSSPTSSTPFTATAPEAKSEGGFGFGSTQTRAAFGSSPFGGQSTQPSSPFGASTSQLAQSSSPFGGFGASTSAPSPTAFGGTASPMSPFGAQAVASSPFGGTTSVIASTPAFGGGTFGAQTTPMNSFGGATAPTTAPTIAFGSTPANQSLNASASPFAPTPSFKSPSVPQPFTFGGAQPDDDAKKAFVPPKPRGLVERLTNEEPSTSAVMGEELGEVSAGKGHVVGTCDLMCPESEREFRSSTGDLEVFERVDSADRTRSSADLCVKKYTRIVDGITPDMVRTKKGLQLASDQLWRVLDGRSEDFMTKSKFLWDRLRSIRQDLNLQQITDSFAVKLMEQMVRYTILAEHELCEETASATNPDGHNSHLNVEQLTKTLTSLRHMYDDHAARGQRLSVDSEAEMYCYQLLLRIDSHGRYAVQRSEMLNDLRGVRPEVLAHPDVVFALECHRAYRESNAAAFFRLVKKASYLQACCLHKFFNSIRGKALEIMNSTFGKFAMGLTEIARLLHTDDIETEALCIHHGLNVSRGKSGEKPPAVIMRESSYISPAEEFPICRSDLVTNKRSESYLLEIVGKDEASRILAKKLPEVTSAISPSQPLKAAPAQLTEAEKKKKQADELRAKIAEREAALAAERAAIAAKKREIEERKAAEKIAADEADRKAKEAQEAAKRAEEEARAAEAKAKAEAEAAEAEQRRIAEEAARAKAEVEAQALAEAERKRAEEEAERRRLAAEQRAREAAEAARLAAIAKMEAEERARRAAAAEKERQRLIAEETERRQAAEAKAARKTAKMQMMVKRLSFSLWRMNAKEFKRERLIDDALLMASPAPALNMGRKGLFSVSAGSARPTDVLAQLRERIESSRSPEFGTALDMSQTIGLALHDAAAMAAPSALVWKCLLCTGAEADSGPRASSRPRTPSAMIAAEWLRSKLTRSGGASVTTTGTGTILSLYGTRLPALGAGQESGFEIGPLAWIVVRDVPAMMERPEGADKGASAGIFILDCGDGMCDDHELTRLRAFHSAVERGDTPLIILVVSREGARRKDIERSIESIGIADALVTFLPSGSPEMWADERFGEMLVWAAERSPKAPRRRIAYLSSEIEEALRPGYINLTVKPHVNPKACVRAFNDALDQVESKILEAARSDDGAEWPPVEISLVDTALPPPGWRSEARRRKVINLLNSVRLPDFIVGENPAHAFIEYVAKVLPQYPDEYGRCMLAQVQYDPHFHKREDVPWVSLFQSLITLLLSGLESRSRDERIYLPPGHPSYTHIPYEPEPELLTTTPASAPSQSTSRKRKLDEPDSRPSTNQIVELDSVPLDPSRAAADDLRRRVAAQSRMLDASERWLAAVASNAPGTTDDPSAYDDIDTIIPSLLAAERAAEARLRALLDAA